MFWCLRTERVRTSALDSDNDDDDDDDDVFLDAKPCNLVQIFTEVSENLLSPFSG
jgi:hypothetical protein